MGEREIIKYLNFMYYFLMFFDCLVKWNLHETASDSLGMPMEEMKYFASNYKIRSVPDLYEKCEINS